MKKSTLVPWISIAALAFPLLVSAGRLVLWIPQIRFIIMAASLTSRVMGPIWSKEEA